jgi:hypothetical protein
MDVAREEVVGGDNVNMGSLGGGWDGCFRGERLSNFWREGAKRAASFEPKDGEDEFIGEGVGRAGSGRSGPSSSDGIGGTAGLSRKIRHK